MPATAMPGKRPQRGGKTSSQPVVQSITPDNIPPDVKELNTPAHRAAIRKLDARRLRFIHEYVQDFNGTQAALRAGYPAGKGNGAAGNTANRLLANPTIRTEIHLLLEDATRRVKVTVDDVLEGLLETRDICLGRKDVPGRKPGTRLFDSGGANRSGELIGRHLQMFVDKLELVHKIDTHQLEERLNAALAARDRRMKLIDGDAERLDGPLPDSDESPADQTVATSEHGDVSTP